MSESTTEGDEFRGGGGFGLRWVTWPFLLVQVRPISIAVRSPVLRTQVFLRSDCLINVRRHFPLPSSLVLQHSDGRTPKVVIYPINPRTAVRRLQRNQWGIDVPERRIPVRTRSLMLALLSLALLALSLIVRPDAVGSTSSIEASVLSTSRDHAGHLTAEVNYTVKGIEYRVAVQVLVGTHVGDRLTVIYADGNPTQSWATGIGPPYEGGLSAIGIVLGLALLVVAARESAEI